MSSRRPSPFIIFVALTLSLGACAPTMPPTQVSGGSLTAFSWLRQVDRAVTDAGCANRAAYPVPGLPMLRTNRFWAAYDPKNLDAAAFRFWVGRLRELDREGRETELACLPEEVKSRLAVQVGKEESELPGLVEGTAERLLAEQMEYPQALRDRLAEVEVPDDYRLWMRAVGLYPLVRFPFALAIGNAYDERRQWYRRDLESFLAVGNWQTFRPKASLPSTGEIERLLTEASVNPLGVPLAPPAETKRLAEAFAPVLVQQTSGPADRWGKVALGPEIPEIRGAEPTVYYYLDHGFWRGAAYLRINYVFWYPLRNGEITPWFENGFLDGITMGVSLDRNGSPFLLQTMNNCGCYLQYFPTAGMVPRPVPFGPDPLVPQALPERKEGERLEAFIDSGWHQVLRLAATGSPPSPAASYELVPYEDLERLPRPGGGVRSLFDAEGIIPGTERPERFFFFPMGIPSVGSMRQLGHQPVNLLDREHYDDPHLIGEIFQEAEQRN